MLGSFSRATTIYALRTKSRGKRFPFVLGEKLNRFYRSPETVNKDQNVKTNTRLTLYEMIILEAVLFQFFLLIMNLPFKFCIPEDMKLTT